MRKYLFLLVVILFVLSNKALAQTEEFSWVYLYYTNSFGPRPVFTVLFNDKEVIQLEKRARVKCKVYSTGNINISCYYGSKNDRLAESFVTLNVQQGKTYYVKLDNTYLKLRLVDEIVGEKEFNNPKLAKIQDFREDVQDPFIKKENVYATKIEKQIVKSDVDVDNDIPTTSTTKSNTYALIIGNEDYNSFQTGLTSEVNVDFALNDAKVFKEYCTKTLGIPEKQVKLLPNATAGQISQGLAWLSNLARVDNGKAELVFYYSGHGLPDEQTKEPYLIPVDISGNNVTLAIKLSDVYAKLNEYPSKKISVFLDACFSGGARNQGLIAMKGVKVKPKEDMITGNMVVLSSSTGEESSGVYREKQHGYMTYFLLKKLQETQGDITYKELADYVVESVKKETALEGKIQTPQCNYSPSIQNVWLNWRMK
ncbi:MAG: caspase family protein [Bacteroidales bacterium]|nr:caspase family protein [Bacteroidales bacterium]